MKKIFYFFIIVNLLACNKNDDNPLEKNSNETESISGIWKIVAYNDLITNSTFTKPTDDAFGDAIIEFDDTTVPHKVLSGQFTGEFSYESEKAIKIDNNYALTEIYEPQWGSERYRLLSLGNGDLEYTLNGDHLEIRNSGENIEAILVRE